MIIYLIKDNYNNYYKIGISKNIGKRIKQLETANPNRLELIETYKSEFGQKTEKTIHNIFSNKKINGEWFKLNNNDIKQFKSMCENIERNFKILQKYENPFI